MTLLVAWRSPRGIHMMSDTRLTFGDYSVDLGIKILSTPYRIYGPGEQGPANVMAEGDLGMGFAGSAVAAFTLTATLRDVLTTLQGAPGYSKFGMDGVVDLLWATYDQQQNALCSFLYGNGLTTLMVTGFCVVQQTQRAFIFEVSPTFQRSYREILQSVDDVEVVGSGTAAARALMPVKPTQAAMIDVVQTVIDDPAEPSVGGAIQFGELVGKAFRTVGVATVKDRQVRHWRGGLDLNDPALTGGNGLVISYPLLDLIWRRTG